jgi:hypothetical protein
LRSDETNVVGKEKEDGGENGHSKVENVGVDVSEQVRLGNERDNAEDRGVGHAEGSRYRELNRRLTYVCRCDERLKAKTEGTTRLVYVYTGLCGGLEHLKIKMRLRNEMFASVMGECVIFTTQVRRRYSK